VAAAYDFCKVLVEFQEAVQVVGGEDIELISPLVRGVDRSRPIIDGTSLNA